MTEKKYQFSIADLKVALTPKLDAKRSKNGGYCGACGNYYSKLNRYTAPKLPGINSRNGAMDICTKCVNRIKSNLPSFLSLDVASVTERLRKKSESRNRTKLVAKQNAENKVANLAQPYIDVGLADVFAHACARNPDSADSILDLWEADWWEQYRPEDPMIKSVLNGEITEEQAKWMDTFRSDHPDLVWALLNKSVPFEWAKALLESGFSGRIEQVSAVLAGGEPRLIARIAKMGCDPSATPPGLDSPADCSEPEISLISLDEEEIVKEMVLDFEDLIPSYDEYVWQISDTEVRKEAQKFGISNRGETESIRKNLCGIVRAAAAAPVGKIRSRKWSKSAMAGLASTLQVRGRSSMNSDELRKVIPKRVKEIERRVRALKL